MCALRAARSDSSLLASSLARKSAICFGRDVERLLEARQAELLEPLARLDRGDHLDVRAEGLGVGLVPHGVVAVEVAVDHVPDRQLGDLGADLPDQGPRGRGLGVGVDDQDVVAVDDDRGVAVQHGGRLRDRGVDPVGDPLEVEEPRRGGAGRGRMAVVGDRPDESSPGEPARGRDEPGRLQPPQHLPPAGPRGPGVRDDAGGWGWSGPP